jgi:hypothetical protein
MSDQPQPLTPADCNLRGLPFMPLDVVRLRDSDTTADIKPATSSAVPCCCGASWHQVPAGSLPDDDIVLSQYAGFGRVMREWQKVRDGALRGWVKCADSRLYHPVVAEKANEAWAGRLKHREKKEAERASQSSRKGCPQGSGRCQRSSAAGPFGRRTSAGQQQSVRRTNATCPDDRPRKSSGKRSERDSGQWRGTVDSGQWTVKA